MIPNPIRKALSTFQRMQVRGLLMGGQACVFYGAAEFSRDLDFAILCEPENLQRLEAALHSLHAEPVALPPLEEGYLLRGHAIHFRCHTPETEGLRIDLMAVQRGVAPFPELWERRTTALLPDGETVELLSLPDLVRAKKTQRDKDWPMIRRLVETNYFANREAPTPEQIAFWLQEIRTPELLLELVVRYPQAAQNSPRPVVAALRDVVAASSYQDQDTDALLERAAALLQNEEHDERQQDREYWQPLRRELESLRHRR